MTARHAFVALAFTAGLAAACDAGHGAPTAMVSSGGDAGGAGGAMRSGLPIGAACEPSGLPCEVDAYCRRAGLDCTGRGVCTEKPVCVLHEPMVCGCDGRVYPSECEANRSGTTVDEAVHCDAPPGHFACDDRYCVVATEVCLVGMGTPACAPLPASCGAPPTCACIKASFTCPGDVDECERGPDGALTFLCTNTH